MSAPEKPPASAEPSGRLKQHRAWYSDRLPQVFPGIFEEPIASDASELLRKKRVADLSIEDGRASGKVIDQEGASHRIEVIFPLLSEVEWGVVLSALASQAYYSALLLAGQLPSEIEDIFVLSGAPLFPKSAEDVEILFQGNLLSELNAEAAAFIYRLSDRLDTDPFAMLALRGRGKEEILLELRRLRSELKADYLALLKVPSLEKESSAERDAELNPALFWSRPTLSEEILFSIRADELPAALLKRLDTPPLAGLEDKVDTLLEEAYEKIARLAQSFGHGV